jgi:hypothetical protein
LDPGRLSIFLDGKEVITMPQSKKTPEAIGKELAETVHAFHAEIIRKGLTPVLANSLAEKIAGASSSYSDGHCGDLPRAGKAMSRPG